MSEQSKGKKILILVAKIAAALLLLTIIVHTAAVLVTGSDLRKAKEAMTAKGYPMTAADIIPQKIPDDQNAAVELKKVFGLLKLGTDAGNGGAVGSSNLAEPFKDIVQIHEELSKDRGAELTDEQAAKLSKLFDHKDVQRVFELLTAAARKKECYFERNYQEGPNLLLPELSPMRDTCRILNLCARFEAQQGNKTAALAKVKESLIIGNAPANEPILISQLVRIANLHIALEALRSVSTRHKLTDAEVKEVMSLTKPYENKKFFLNSMHGERLLFGQWFFERDKAIDVDAIDIDSAKFLRYYNWYPFRPFFNSDYASYLNCMRLNTEHMEKDLKTAMAEDLDKKVIDQMGKLAIITKMVAPALSRIRMKIAAAKAMIQMTEIAIACNQYRHQNGTYPDSLEAVAPTPVEEATGKPFLYRKTDAGAVIYSGCDKYSGKTKVDGKKVLGVELKAADNVAK